MFLIFDSLYLFNVNWKLGIVFENTVEGFFYFEVLIGQGPIQQSMQGENKEVIHSLKKSFFQEEK